MPRIPTYDNFQTSVAAEPAAQFQGPSGPQAGAIAAEQAGQTGQALQRGASELGRIGLDIQHQANQVQVSSAMNKLMAAKLKLTYDPTEGFTQRKGQAALDPDAEGKPLDESYVEKLQKTIDEVGASLGNDQQRVLFKQQADQVSMQFRTGLTAHIGKEYADHAVSVQQGTTKLGQDMMGIDPFNVEQVQQGRDAIKAATAEEGRLRGWSAAMVEAATREQLSRGHEAVVMGAIQAGKPEYATAYLKQVNDELNDNTRLKLTAHATEADVLVRGEQAAGEAWAKLGPKDVNDAVKLFDIEQSVREQYKDNPRLLKAALDGVKLRAATFNAQQAEVNAASTNAIYGMIDQGTPLAKVKTSASWLALPEAKRHDITKGLEAEAATREARGAARAQRSLAEMQRNDRMALLTNGGDYLHDSNPDVLASASRAQVEALRTKYGLEGTQTLLAKWDSLQNKDARLTAKIDDHTFKSVVHDVLGVDPYKVSNADTKAMLGSLQNRVDIMLQSKAQQLRRPLTTEEKTELFKSEISKTVTVDGWMWNSDKPVASLTPAEAAKVVIPKNQEAELIQSMKAAFARTGDKQYEPTPENMRRIYLKSISPLAGLPNAPK